MGLVHTAIRSKLSIDKVRKTTILGMDLKREHINAGLVQPRTHRHFEAPTSNPTGPEAGSTVTDFEPSDFEDVFDFDQLAEQLIEEAADDDIGSATDLDTDDNGPPPPFPLPLSQSGSRSMLSKLHYPTVPRHGLSQKLPSCSSFFQQTEIHLPLARITSGREELKIWIGRWKPTKSCVPTRKGQIWLRVSQQQAGACRLKILCI